MDVLTRVLGHYILTNSYYILGVRCLGSPVLESFSRLREAHPDGCISCPGQGCIAQMYCKINCLNIMLVMTGAYFRCVDLGAFRSWVDWKARPQKKGA